jgi:hypothetical protein
LEEQVIVHEFVARYSEDIGREAVRRFLRRRLRQLLDFKFCAALFVLTACLGWLLWTGNRSGWVGLLAALIVLMPAVMLGAYAAHWRNTVGRIRQMQAPMARFTLSESDITMASELGSAIIPWSLIVEIWEYPELWLLLLSKSNFVTLPIEGVPVAALEFLRAKVRSAHEASLAHPAT